MIADLTCQDCGPVTPNLKWQPKANGGHHLRADCPNCGCYLKFVPQASPWLEMAGAPSEPAQDDQLTLFEGIAHDHTG